ncbi:MAG: type VI secretion system baseplate subunit TssK [Betaproteobacteria bacterium]|nr:type VI secretion system baseplate subunit TssK [Betaproteobacteria bacterium]
MTIQRPSLPVQWHEGMLLSPQHFQQDALHRATDSALKAYLSQPMGWGVERLEFDNALLSGGRIRVLSLRAVFPDGTPVWYEAEEDPPLEIDAADALNQTTDEPLDLFLRLPTAHAVESEDRPGRYLSAHEPPVADLVSEAMPIDVPRLKLNLSLALGPPPSGSFTRLRLGAVRNEGGSLRMTQTLPALLRFSAAPALVARLRSLAADLRSKASFVARQVAGMTDPSRLQEKLLVQQQLSCMVLALPAAEAISQSTEIHPWNAYTALVGMSAQLSQLHLASVPPPTPAYQHEDPYSAFDRLLGQIEQAVQEISQSYREIRFGFREGVFALDLQPTWIDGRLVVGVQGPSTENLVLFMETAVIGPASRYAELQERRVLGLRRTRIAAAEELSLKPLPGTVFYELIPSEELREPEAQLVIAPTTRSAQMQPPKAVVLYVANTARPAR